MKKSTAIAALGALAQETRLDIFRLLVEKGPAGLPAGEIGTRLGQASPPMSFHLNQLRFAGLVRSRRESRSIISSASCRAMSSLPASPADTGGGGPPDARPPAPPPACGTECAPG